MRNFLSVKDLPASVDQFLDKCLSIKANSKPYRYAGENKALTCLLFNPDLRTSLSTDKAARNINMYLNSLDATNGMKLELLDEVIMDLDKTDHIKEAAAMISQYTDILAVSTMGDFEDRETDYQERVIKAFAKYATVPVINLESAIRHPLQSLADCITIKEQSSRPKPKVVLTWAPHPEQLPQTIANSFVEWMKAWGEVDLVVANPPGMELSPEFTEGIPVYHDQELAFTGADFVYAKNWSSYQDYGKILTDAHNWRVTREDMNRTNNGKFMHCLPVRRNVVVSDDVLDCDESLVMEQAANRTWAMQAVLLEILEGLEK